MYKCDICGSSEIFDEVKPYADPEQLFEKPYCKECIQKLENRFNFMEYCPLCGNKGVYWNVYLYRSNENHDRFHHVFCKNCNAKWDSRFESKGVKDNIYLKLLNTTNLDYTSYVNIEKEITFWLEKSIKKDSTKKIFSNCPYCGEELKLLKQPKFCPYCREEL